MNSSYYAIVTSTSVNDYWYRLNIMASIINLDKFPSTVKFLSNTVVLSVSKTVTSWSEFEGFVNVSYCFGYSGLNANTSDSLDIYWKEYNNTAIQANLSLLTYARYSYMIIWN